MLCFLVPLLERDAWVTRPLLAESLETRCFHPEVAVVELRRLLAHHAAEEPVEAKRQRHSGAEWCGLGGVFRVHEHDAWYPGNPGKTSAGLERGDLELRRRKLRLPYDRSAAHGNRFVEQLHARDRRRPLVPSLGVGQHLPHALG